METVTAVHQNQDRSLYERASRSLDFYLFYSPEPMETGEVTREEDFAGKYFVHSHKALDLYNMIITGKSPLEIIDGLGLSKKSLREVINVYRWESQHRGVQREERSEFIRSPHAFPDDSPVHYFNGADPITSLMSREKLVFYFDADKGRVRKC
mgnify:CR=1 FL=1